VIAPSVTIAYILILRYLAFAYLKGASA